MLWLQKGFQIISIDGKTLCGSKSEEDKPIHMISAWATEQEPVLGQMCVDEKTNEIPTVPLLLELLDMPGSTGRYPDSWALIAGKA
ncbi:MAG: hypothetical protein IKR85_11015 [Clostridia bacterium]|nr:hypothetical protein [Clostridia bacterium]